MGGRGQPLSPTLSLGEILWFDVPGKIQRCDWSENAVLVCTRYDFPGSGLFSANHSAVFSPVHQTTESRQQTVWATVVDPSLHGYG